MPDTSLPTGPAVHRSFGHTLRHGVTVVLFSTAIATLLWLTRQRNAFDIDFVYSQSVGLTTWLMVELLARLLNRDPERFWPTGWRAPVMLVTSTVLGYVIGTTIGDAYRGGFSTWSEWQRSPKSFASYVAVSLAASAVVIYYFHSRGMAQTQAARLAAAERDAAQAKLAMLQSQIEPHMLFNTLANLRVLIALDPPRAQAMLDQLIAFLRATLDASRAGSHSLEAEFQRIGDYLALMQVRMGARLTTQFELPAGLARLEVPPLLLQPLVENAIKHGLEPRVEGGRIDVVARRSVDGLVLSVRDTGLGLGAPGADGARFGLHQVKERLKTLYGDRASFRLEAAGDDEGGTIATLQLPIATPP